MKINILNSRILLPTVFAFLCAFSSLGERAQAEFYEVDEFDDLQLVVGEGEDEELFSDWELLPYEVDFDEESGTPVEVWYVVFADDQEQEFEGSFFYSESFDSYYVGTAEGQLEALGDEDPVDDGDGYYTEEELEGLLDGAYWDGYDDGYDEGEADGYAKGYQAGRAAGLNEVRKNPGKFNLFAAAAIPSEILITTRKGNTVTVSLQGKWSRFAASGVPQGWKFNTKTGLLTGAVNGQSKIRLQAYQKSSAAVPVQIILKPAKK